mgnify:FL=1
MLKYIIATKINIKGIELNNRIFFVSSNPSTTRNKPGNTINTIENNILNNISGSSDVVFIEDAARTYAHEL